MARGFEQGAWWARLPLEWSAAAGLAAPARPPNDVSGAHLEAVNLGRARRSVVLCAFDRVAQGPLATGDDGADPVGVDARE